MVEVIIIHVGSLGITRGYGRYIEAGAPYLDDPRCPKAVAELVGSFGAQFVLGRGLGQSLGPVGISTPTTKKGPQDS